MVEFLVLQAYYLYDYLGRQLGDELGSLTSTLGLEDKVEQAKKIIVDDLGV